jgi:hypothetical protein
MALSLNRKAMVVQANAQWLFGYWASTFSRASSLKFPCAASANDFVLAGL